MVETIIYCHKYKKMTKKLSEWSCWHCRECGEPKATISIPDKTEWTPHEISVIFHCHTSPYPHPNLVMAECLTHFLKLGLIKPSGETNGYSTTEKGKAWVKMICSTQLPRQVWVDESNNVIGDK